jgi:hypothetical protein
MAGVATFREVVQFERCIYLVQLLYAKEDGEIIERKLKCRLHRLLPSIWNPAEADAMTGRGDKQ